MSELLYMRKISFTCGATMTAPLTIHFTIPFDDSEKVNDAEIKVYNLKDSTVNGIAAKTAAVLNAGYQTDSGVIFDGVLKSKSTKWEGVDKITTFICADTQPNYLEKDFKKSYARNTPASAIISEVIGVAGLSIGEMSLPRNFMYRTGKTVHGKPKAILTELAKDCKAKLYVNKGKVYMRDKDKGTPAGIMISKETGLIGEPEAISDEITDANKKKKKRSGYKIKSLLNHRITADTIISLASKKVSGSFRVERGQHICDGSSFYTEMEVYPA